MPIHVVLLPTVPVLALWSAPTGTIRSLSPALIATGLALAGGLIAAVYLVLERDLRRAALMAVALVLCTTTVGHVVDTESGILVPSLVLLAGIVLCIVAISRLTPNGLRLTTILLNVIATPSSWPTRSSSWWDDRAPRPPKRRRQPDRSRQLSPRRRTPEHALTARCGVYPVVIRSWGRNASSGGQ